jgi:Fe2+ transport system protein FeoA
VLPEMPALYTLEPGDVAVVAISGSTDPEIIAFLESLGLRPGVRVEVMEKQAFDGPLVLRVDGLDRTLGSAVANQVFVQKSPATSSSATSSPGTKESTAS